MRFLFVFLPCLLGLSAFAETTDTTTFQVNAQVQSSCRVEVEDFRFPALEEASDQRLNSTGSMRVHCTRGTHVGVMLDQGQNFDAENGVRRLVGEQEGDALGYRILLHQEGDAEEVGAAALVSDGRRQALSLNAELTDAPDGSRFLSDTLTITLVY